MPILKSNSTTLIIEDIVVSNAFVNGDNMTITYVNPRTSQVNSGNGKTIQTRADADEADLVFNVIKHSDEEIALSYLANTEATSFYTGTAKTLIYKDDGDTMFETYSITAGSFTAQPTATFNNQDVNATMTYTIRCTAKRFI